jgi:hypothetical protein
MNQTMAQEVTEARFARVETQVSSLSESVATLSADVRSVVGAIEKQGEQLERQWQAIQGQSQALSDARKPNYGVMIGAVTALGAFIALYVDPVRELVFTNKETNQQIVENVHKEDIRRARWEGRIEAILNMNGDTPYARPD